jgi:hypothetical protein
MLACPAFVISATGLAPAIASFVIDVTRRSWNGRIRSGYSSPAAAYAALRAPENVSYL